MYLADLRFFQLKQYLLSLLGWQLSKDILFHSTYHENFPQLFLKFLQVAGTTIINKEHKTSNYRIYWFLSHSHTSMHKKAMFQNISDLGNWSGE